MKSEEDGFGMVRDSLNKLKEMILTYTNGFPLKVEVDFHFAGIGSTGRDETRVTFGIFLSDPVNLTAIERQVVIRKGFSMIKNDTRSQNEAIREITGGVMKELIRSALIFLSKREIMEEDDDLVDAVPKYSI
jgi:hypothetical protein